MNPVAVKQFVRDIIGCNCPEEVFNHIEVIRCDTNVRNSSDCEINIGGRLLILVTDQTLSAQDFAGLMQKGKSARDARGFNRFRLVVVADNPSEVETTLSQQFDELFSQDPKLHLHVIARNSFPDLFTEA